MKKYLITSLIVAMSVLTMAPAMAQEVTSTSSTPVATTAPAKFVRRAVSITGTVSSLAGTTAPTSMVINVKNLTPKKAKKWTGAYPTVGQTLTVQIASTTRVIRELSAKASLSEIQVGDTVRLVVKTNQDGTVTAQVVKDDSIHAALRTGKVTSIDIVNASFVLTTGKTSVTVKTDANTKIKVAKVTNPTLSNLTVGNTVTVNGYINTNTKTVYAAKTVRLLKK